jgi:hypothetical protein
MHVTKDAVKSADCCRQDVFVSELGTVGGRGVWCNVSYSVVLRIHGDGTADERSRTNSITTGFLIKKWYFFECFL